MRNRNTHRAALRKPWKSGTLYLLPSTHIASPRLVISRHWLPQLSRHCKREKLRRKPFRDSYSTIPAAQTAPGQRTQERATKRLTSPPIARTRDRMIFDGPGQVKQISRSGRGRPHPEIRTENPTTLKLSRRAGEENGRRRGTRGLLRRKPELNSSASQAKAWRSLTWQGNCTAHAWPHQTTGLRVEERNQGSRYRRNKATQTFSLSPRSNAPFS